MAYIIQTADLTLSTRLSPDYASWVYNGLDCCITNEVYRVIHPLLDDVSRATYELSKALQGPILDMNMAGIPIDGHALMEAKTQISIEMEKLEAILYEYAVEGYSFPLTNWRSPTQMKAFLYDYIGLPVQRKRNTNGVYAPTTDRGALEKLQHYFVIQPFVLCLLRLRDLGKKLGFLNTEIDSDGFMRCNFNIAGTKTGRLASSYSNFGTGTNLQNIDRLLKSIFVARPGHKFVNFDLEQADSRNVGAACWNKFLQSHGPRFAGSYLDACESGDLHTLVCKMGWPFLAWTGNPKLDREIADGIAYREMSYRDLAKRLGHGTNYYGQPPTMAKHSQIPTEMAVDFQRQYFSAFPCIREGHKFTKAELESAASITTILGRRRYFFGRLQDDKTLRDAIAYEGQSATADEINHGLLNLWRGGSRFPGFQLRCQVHDSLLIEIAEECEDEFIPWALEAMKHRIVLAGDREFVVPTEAKTGWNWGDYSLTNLDGQKKWKGGDERKRLVPYRRSFKI